jgi:hypothetical protein
LCFAKSAACVKIGNIKEGTSCEESNNVKNYTINLQLKWSQVGNIACKIYVKEDTYRL